MAEEEAAARWHALWAARTALIHHYAPLVHDMVGGVARKGEPSLAGHDLVSYGMFALIEAVDTYVPGPHGNRFEAYATPLIEAAILDELQQD